MDSTYNGRQNRAGFWEEREEDIRDSGFRNRMQAYKAH